METLEEEKNESSEESHLTGKYPHSDPLDESFDEENRQTAVMEQIEKETEDHRRVLPVEYWKKIFSSYR